MRRVSYFWVLLVILAVVVITCGPDDEPGSPGDSGGGGDTPGGSNGANGSGTPPTSTPETSSPAGPSSGSPFSSDDTGRRTSGIVDVTHGGVTDQLDLISETVEPKSDVIPRVAGAGTLSFTAETVDQASCTLTSTTEQIVDVTTRPNSLDKRIILWQKAGEAICNRPMGLTEAIFKLPADVSDELIDVNTAFRMRFWPHRLATIGVFDGELILRPVEGYGREEITIVAGEELVISIPTLRIVTTDADFTSAELQEFERLLEIFAEGTSTIPYLPPPRIFLDVELSGERLVEGVTQETTVSLRATDEDGNPVSEIDWSRSEIPIREIQPGEYTADIDLSGQPVGVGDRLIIGTDLARQVTAKTYVVFEVQPQIELEILPGGGGGIEIPQGGGGGGVGVTGP